MVKRSVLVVEDEGDIREMISYNLQKEGYEVVAVASGEEALRLADLRDFDVVLLDLMLPGIDGLSVCRELKKRQTAGRSWAIIMVSAKRGETDVVVGLRLGADDYVTKPFSPKVLLARVEAVLRRTDAESANDNAEPDATIRIHNLVIHTGQHRVYCDDEPIELSRTEYRVLNLLVSRPGWVFDRERILDSLYGDRHAVSDRAVDVQIVGLRRKLGSAGRYIETVRGVGYRLKE